MQQECPPLIIGKAGINHPARPAEDIGKLQQKGVKVFALRDDLETRGINGEGCIDGVQMISGRDIAGLLEGYDQVWHW